MPAPLHAERELILSTAAGSTTHRAGEVAKLLAHTLDLQAKQHAAGIDAGRQAAQRSEEMRSAVRQAVGAEPVKAGPYRGKFVQPISLDLHAVGKVIRRIQKNLENFGTSKAPGKTVVGEVLAQLKKKPPAG